MDTIRERCRSGEVFGEDCEFFGSLSTVRAMFPQDEQTARVLRSTAGLLRSIPVCPHCAKELNANNEAFQAEIDAARLNY